jgi:uncharacterized protein (DUF1697 family)
MATYIALLRGINVGGRKKVRMADLRALLAGIGYRDVVTHLQSGNACFTSDRDSPEAVAREIEDRIAADLGLDVKVLVRTRDELAAVVENNPLPEVTSSPAKLHVAFLSASPPPQRRSAIDPEAFAPAEFRIGEREVYVWYPNGLGRSKLTNDVWERRLGVTATMRNWNSVTKLLDLAGAAD